MRLQGRRPHRPDVQRCDPVLHQEWGDLAHQRLRDERDELFAEFEDIRHLSGRLDVFARQPLVRDVLLVSRCRVVLGSEVTRTAQTCWAPRVRGGERDGFLGEDGHGGSCGLRRADRDEVGDGDLHVVLKRGGQRDHA